MATGEFTQIAMAIAMAGAVLLWLLPSPCKCEKCGFHVNERRVRHEENRAESHRNMHSYWKYPWGDERCGSCRKGHADDKRD
jgi:hypothetical protein